MKPEEQVGPRLCGPGVPQGRMWTMLGVHRGVPGWDWDMVQDSASKQQIWFLDTVPQVGRG